MELSLHIRKHSETDHLDAVADHISDFYEGGLPEGINFPPIDRIYVGDEFCPLRLPDKAALNRFCQYAGDNRMELTLLIPVLTDIFLERCTPLFDALATWNPSAEVVVNDLGTLLFLQKHYALFCLSMGRLFNKGFKDPRLETNNGSRTPEIEALLSESTFDHPEFHSILDKFDMSRVERDLLPNAVYLPKPQKDYHTSYYFPYGYVTTGRICWTATFAKNACEDYKPLYRCTRPCEGLTFRLNGDGPPEGLLQSGNTIFYQYSPDLLSALVKLARQGNDRMIYQGLSL